MTNYNIDDDDELLYIQTGYTSILEKHDLLLWYLHKLSFDWYIFFSKILSNQVSGEDESKEKKDEGVRAAREFRSRSDEVMKKLVDWLAKHQTVENPLKFSQFD